MKNSAEQLCNMITGNEMKYDIEFYLTSSILII